MQTLNEFPEVVMPRCEPRHLLAGQSALVTGANSGIGRAVAIHLAGEGAAVAVNYVAGDDAALEMVDEIKRNSGNATAFKADVSNEAEVWAMFGAMIKAFGTIDILMNNAGLQRDAPLDQMMLEQWNTVIGVNLTGLFLNAREAVREFKRRGVRKEISCAAGKIVVMSSVHEVISWAGHVNYAA